MLENEEVSTEIETESQEVQSESSSSEVAEEVVEQKEPESESSGESVDAEAAPAVDASAYKPNVKFKANEKEMEIPKEYHSLLKSPESEKAVKELFEKAYGLDSVKEKLANTRLERDRTLQEANGLKTAIGKARNTYQSAVQSGNWHKMDDFFKTLGVSQDHVMAYAIEKAKLHEMEPNQRQLIESRLQAERDFEYEQESRQSLQAQVDSQASQMKRFELESTLSRQDVTGFSQQLESAFNRPGLFRQEVIAAGEAAWNNEGKNIPVVEAVQRVIAKYGLTAQKQSVAAQATQSSGKKIIQKQSNTIPNVSGSSGSSPLSSNKPKSVDDIKKLRDRVLAGEQV